ncbi:MAG: hypothetical protein JKY30_05955 [Flavobacteriales bacterium]|nr:hypothetical protein [Flavobacteriales bacterium]
MKNLILIFFLTLIFSCNQHKSTVETSNLPELTESTNQETETTEKIFITMERSPCYGQCATYKIKIYNTGKVEYEGIKFAKKIGAYTKILNQNQLTEIKNQIEFIKLFEMKDKYDSNISDIPSTLVLVIYKGKKKIILDRFGAPNELKQFEKLIDYFVIDDKLIKAEDKN